MTEAETPAAGTPARSTGGLRHRLVELLRLAALVAVVAVVARVGASNYGSVRHIHLRVHPGWLAGAAPASLAGGLLMPLGWRWLLGAYGHSLRVAVALRIWWTAQITRYVPTGAAALATRVVLAGREGVPRLLAAASLPIEVAIVVGWGGLLTAVFLPSGYLPAPWRVVVGAGAAIGLVAFPVLLRTGGRLVKRLTPLGPGGGSGVYRAVGAYGVNSALRSASFVLLAAALLPVKGGDTALLVGAFNAGAVAGLVSIAPGGLGVREGVLTLILRSRYGFGDAAAMAVALRAWDLVIDVIWLAAARAAGARTGSRAGAGRS